MDFARGACVFFSRGGGLRRIQRDMVNERAVRILLECILVEPYFPTNSLKTKKTGRDSVPLNPPMDI